ncbi:hypothetical protein XENOCAPTIV_030623 [Xenoophorus captivus]|uniref:Uncharacterized protein n=1 Tax=Xenoophorus captivus TaxID=1517983 RepID=A0ABV0RWM3_9TELE
MLVVIAQTQLLPQPCVIFKAKMVQMKPGTSGRGGGGSLMNNKNRQNAGKCSGSFLSAVKSVDISFGGKLYSAPPLPTLLPPILKTTLCNKQMSGPRLQMKDGFTKSPCCSSFKLIRNHILLFPLHRHLFTFSLRPLEQICNMRHE